MPFVQIAEQVINPLHVTRVEPGEINRTVVDDAHPGLTQKDIVECVYIHIAGSDPVIVEGTGDYLAVANLLSSGLDDCLRLCSVAHYPKS